MKAIADEVIGYSEDNARILDASGNTILIYRPWYNCMDGVETQENPIVFGQSGFYGDWVEVSNF